MHHTTRRSLTSNRPVDLDRTVDRDRTVADRAARPHVRSRRWLVGVWATATAFGLTQLPVEAATIPVPTVPSTPTVPTPSIPVPSVPTDPGAAPATTAPAMPTTAATTTSPTTTSPTTTSPAQTSGSTIATTNTTNNVPTSTTSATTTTPATTTPAATTTTTTTAPPRQGPPLSSYSQEMRDILETIRYLESRGQYEIPPNKGNASGAYQFIESTWNNYGGYRHAYLAPPSIQDERAAADVTKFLQQWNNDVTMIPVMWYYPIASRQPELMDLVPVPQAGNVLTVRQYQQRWLGVWSSISGKPAPTPADAGSAATTTGTAGGDTSDGATIDADGTPAAPAGPTEAELAAERAAQSGAPPTPWTRSNRIVTAVSYPVLGPSRIAAPSCDGNAELGATADDVIAAGLCAQAAPAIVFGVKLQPVLAVATGVVTDVYDEPGEPISVTITDVYGRSYTYTGFNDDTPGTNDGAAPEHLRLTQLAELGNSVWAGQVIGFMGDTAPLPAGIRSTVPIDPDTPLPEGAVAPHIRLEIEDINGTPIDAYGPVIDALYLQLCHAGTGPWASTPSGVDLATVTVAAMDVHDDVDSRWEITSTGEVRATGWAAMIYPTEGCPWIARATFGAAGAGAIPDDNWGGPVRLSTTVWLSLGRREMSDRPLPPVVRGL